MVDIDDLFNEDEKALKSCQHNVKIDADTKALLDRVREKIGEKNTAEVLRRFMRAGLTQALEHPKAKR